MCRKGDRGAWCLARNKVEKQRMEAPLSSSTLTPRSVSFSLPFILYSCTSLSFILSLILHIVFFFSSSSFGRPPSPLLSALMYLAPLFPVRCSSSPISIVDASLSLSLSPCSSCLFGHGPISPIGLVAV